MLFAVRQGSEPLVNGMRLLLKYKELNHAAQHFLTYYK